MAALDDDAPFGLGVLGSGPTPGSRIEATEDDWLRAAAAVLRPAGRLPADDPDSKAWAALARRTLEGITIPPLGTAARAGRAGPESTGGESTDGESTGGRPAGAAASITGPARTDGSGWDIRALITDTDAALAAASAVDDLENGATSLWLTLDGAGTELADLPSVLDGVYLDMAPVILRARGASGDLAPARAFADLLRARGLTPAPGTNLGADPIGRVVRRAVSSESTAAAGVAAAVTDIAELATDLGTRALVVDGTVAHDAGSGDAAELGFGLAVGAAYLRILTGAGVGLRDALRLIEFSHAATDEQFVTIAKFRAARVLWGRVAQLSGAGPAERAHAVHAVTSGPMMTRYDPWVNLMRTTIAAFAAGIGGADAVTVLPFDSALGVPDGLGRRMARNISSLLISEAHVAEVADPAGGAYAVQMLTDQVADAAWAEFQLIEAAGGVLAAAGDGTLTARWAAAAQERRRRIARRRLPITGVTEFPHSHEVLPARRPIGTAAGGTGVGAGGDAAVDTGERWAGEFEDLRDHPAAAPVFLATLGPLAQHTVRASFAGNLFAAGGVDTVSAGSTSGVADVVQAYRRNPSPVACLAGTDAAYREFGAAVVAGLRDAGARRVVLAGRPTGELADLADLIDDHIGAGDDVLLFLRRTREHLEPAGASR